MGPKNDIKVIGKKGKFISLSPPSVKVSMVACHKAWRNRRSGRIISFSSLRLPVIFLLSKGFDPRLCSVSFCEALPIPLCMVATSGFPCRSNHHSIHLPPCPFLRRAVVQLLFIPPIQYFQPSRISALSDYFPAHYSYSLCITCPSLKFALC